MRWISTVVLVRMASSQSRSLHGWARHASNPEVDTFITRQHTPTGRSPPRPAMKVSVILGGRSPERCRRRHTLEDLVLELQGARLTAQLDELFMRSARPSGPGFEVTDGLCGWGS